MIKTLTLRASEFLLDLSLIELIFHVWTYSKILSLSNFIHSDLLSRTIETLVFIFSGKICSQFYIWFYIRRKKNFRELFCSLLFLLPFLSRGQFHQHFASSFFVWKFWMQLFSCESFCAQLFCTYILGLYLFDARLSEQKLVLKCWWNWHQEAFLLYRVKRNFVKRSFFLSHFTSFEGFWII